MSSISKLLLVFIVSTFIAILPAAVRAKPSILQRPSLIITTKKSSKPKKDDAYLLLARSIQDRLNKPTDSESSPTQYDVGKISSALRSLSTTQAALKKIDGTAHEMYQRTHKSSTSLDEELDDEEGDESGKIGGLKVAGRMSRNAARVGCIADAFFAAELCELIKLAPPAMTDEDDANHGDATEVEENDTLYGEEGTLAPWTERKVVLNTTIHSDDHDLAISVLVIYEPDYNGHAGIRHGGVDDLLSFAKEEIEEEDENDHERSSNSTALAGAEKTQAPRGRYLVILSDQCSGQQSSSSSDLPSIISILDTPPERVRLQSHPRLGDKDNSASVCGPLYHMTGKLLEVIGPVFLDDSKDSSGGESSENEEEEEEGNQGADTVDDGNFQSAKPAIHFVGYSLAGGVAAMADRKSVV